MAIYDLNHCYTILKNMLKAYEDLSKFTEFLWSLEYHLGKNYYCFVTFTFCKKQKTLLSTFFLT